MKIVVVGAKGTIGSRVAERFESEGHEVVRASRSSQPSLDLESGDSMRSFFEGVGEVDAVVCVAGDAPFAPFAELAEADWDAGLRSKLLGQIGLVRRSLPFLKPGGSMVLTSGMLAHTPWPGTSALAVVNAGIEAFARAFQLEMPDGQSISVVCPPLVAETAKMMQLDAPAPTAAEVAEFYLQALDKDAPKVVFVEGFAPAA